MSGQNAVPNGKKNRMPQCGVSRMRKAHTRIYSIATKLTVTIASLLGGTCGLVLVFRRIPVDFEIVLLALLVELDIHVVDDLLICPALEGDHLPKVIEAWQGKVINRTI